MLYLNIAVGRIQIFLLDYLFFFIPIAYTPAYDLLGK